MWCREHGYRLTDEEMRAFQSCLREFCQKTDRLYCRIIDDNTLLFDEEAFSSLIRVFETNGIDAQRLASLRARLKDVQYLDLFPDFCTIDEFLARVRRSLTDRQKEMLASAVERLISEAREMGRVYELHTTSANGEVSAVAIFPAELILMSMGVVEPHSPYPTIA
jgi:hypothetical protein